MKWLGLAAGALVLLAGALALVGSLLPREHTATCSARFRTGAEALFARLADFASHPAWRADVRAVRLLEPLEGSPRFVEETADGPRTYVVEASEPPRRLVLRGADEGLPYGGTWSFRVEPEGGGCRVTVTEDGFVDPVIFRALARFAFGHHSSMEAYLRALARGLGEEVAIERGP